MKIKFIRHFTLYSYLALSGLCVPNLGPVRLELHERERERERERENQ